MFEFLRRPTVNRIDEFANRLAREGKVASLESELEKYDPRELRGVERESWFHLRGVTAFQRGDRATAFARFSEARSACPRSSLIAFSLAQEHEFRGEIDEMFTLFDEFRFPQLPARHALAQARYAYLWGDNGRGLRYVLPIVECHFDLKIADDTFLYLRGMPFFSQTWAYAAAFYELRSELDSLSALTGKAKRVLTDYDAAPLEKLTQAVASGDFSPYMAKPARGSAYEQVLSAVLLAQRAATFQHATDHLDEVHLTKNDFPWLADILLLARAEAAHLHAVDEERRLTGEFVRKQPLLFEPDHAFNFRLLGYQETLKLGYQEARRRGAD